MASTINASTSSGLVSTADTSGVLQLQTAGTTAVTVDASQNVGIGTTSPSTKLHVSGIFRQTDGTVQAEIASGGSVAFYGTNNNYPVAIQTNALERARFDTSGNLGIGTSSPGVKLDVVGVARASTRVVSPAFYGSSTGITEYMDSLGTTGIYVTGAGASPSNSIRFFSAGSTTATLDTSGNLGLGVTPSAWRTSAKAIQIKNYTTLFENTGGASIFSFNSYQNSGGGYTYIQPEFASQYYQVSGRHEWYTAPSGTAGNAITFTQAMTLNNSGNLLVGTTSGGATDSNSFSYAPASVKALDLNHLTATASGTNYARFNYAGSTIGSITQNGTTGVLYNLTSDQRLKENIQDAESASNLIDAIQVRQYDWKSDGSHQRYGFVAQELVAVAPEAVHQPADPDEMMAVDYSKLVPMLVKEIQSLRIRIAQLEAK
jgi:hypothetical protein